MSCLIHASDFEELAWQYFQRAKEDGVVHAEVFFDPQAHTGRGVRYETVVQGFVRACRRAEKELGMSVLLVVCFLRHLPVPESLKMYEEAEADLKSGVLAGIGLDSSEKGYPPGKWREIYGRAKSMGIRRTAHAGEEGPVEYIREALQELGVQRVDHGIRLAEDEELMKEVARRQLLITVCPLSNLRLRCVQSIGELPIREFLDAGVAFSINSDDPAYFAGYILDNYCAIQQAFELTVEEWRRIALVAIDKSWCGEERKEVVKRDVERVVKAHSRE